MNFLGLVCVLWIPLLADEWTGCMCNVCVVGFDWLSFALFFCKLVFCWGDGGGVHISNRWPQLEAQKGNERKIDWALFSLSNRRACNSNGPIPDKKYLYLWSAQGFLPRFFVLGDKGVWFGLQMWICWFWYSWVDWNPLCSLVGWISILARWNSLPRELIILCIREIE